MTRHTQKDRAISGKNQRGITGLETAIVLIAFVVVASVFAFAVITTGVFSSEQAQGSAEAGVKAAKATMVKKGSIILSEAISAGSPSIAGTSTLMTDTVSGAFVAEGIKIGDLIRNVTDSSSATITAVTATTITSNALSGGTANTWALTDAYEVDMDQVGTITFKVTPSPGAVPFGLASGTTLVSFNDANNAKNGLYLASIPTGSGADPFATANTAYWTHKWLVGTGPALDTGEVVEFTVNIKSLSTPLTKDQAFSVEIVPQSGAAMAVSRTTPLEMAKVMDLN